MKLYLIDEGQVAVLRATMTRLHSETRMNGDEMRDLGHGLESVIRVVESLEIPEDNHEQRNG